MNFFTSVLILLPFVFSSGALTKANLETNKRSALDTKAALVQAPRIETHYGPAF